MFYLPVVEGQRYLLYKTYQSQLSYVSTNYIQSELRQYDLNYEYYYTDKLKPGLKKLKTSAGAIKKEFKDTEGIIAIVNDNAYSHELETSLIRIFEILNKQSSK